MNSIRKQLLVSILTLVVVVTALLVIATNISVREELDELYDENMKQVALVLAGTGLDDGIAAVTNPNMNKTLNGEEEFLIQVWRDGTLEYSSHPAIIFTLQPENEFGTTEFNGRQWRYYRLDHDGAYIQVAQDLHKRHGVVAEIYNVFVVPILIQLPLLAGLIWVLVGLAMKPLTRLSRLIEARSASFLEPIADDGVPLEIRSLVDALNSLLVRLETALTAQRRFTADAAHELRTPLTAVRLQVDILKRATENDERADAMATLEMGVNRSIRLVQQLLEMARQEPENMQHPHSTVNLESVIRDVEEQLEPLARTKKIMLGVNIGRDLTVKGSAPQLNVMIGNLLNNAILYTPEKGHVTLTAHSDGENVIVDITDDGIGIAQKDMPRIFDRFYRVAGTNTTGSGLGLSIVRSIAVSHGIGIDVSPNPAGKGTRFRLTIKAASS